MRRKLTPLRISVVLLLLAVIVQIPQTGKAAPVLQLTENDWPMLMHDPSHSGYTNESIAPEPVTDRLNLKWKVGLGERIEIETQPIVAYGKVYVGVMSGKLHAINTDTGQIEWTYQAGGAIPHTAAAANGKVYFGCEDGKVYALDANTGGLIWSYQTDEPVLSAPTVVDNVLYIGSFDTYLYALDADTGDLEWRYKTGARVWSSPAYYEGKIYFGSEDMHAYCLNTEGQLLWQKQLSGVSMRNIYPVVSEGVAIFTTVKPGQESYMPWEDVQMTHDTIQPADWVIDYWNTYYLNYPNRRYLYYFDAQTGADLWDPGNKRFVPFPLPYWGLIIPLVDNSGHAWFPASGLDGDHALDHGNRLWKVNLSTGEMTEEGSQAQYMMRFDETGRHTMAGYMYYQTGYLSMGMFDTINKEKYHIYGRSWSCTPHYCEEFLSPPPTIHWRRYAGAKLAGHIPAPSPLIIADGVGYFTNYSWLYALVSDDVAEPGVVNLGIDHTLGPAHTEKSYEDFVDELNWRVEQIIASGPLRPQPLFWGWNRQNLHLIWLEGEAIVSLAQTIPYLRADLQEDLKAYLRTAVITNVLEIGYNYRKRCMIYGQDGVIDPCSSSDREGEISFYWFGDDRNVIAENLYAIWAYAHYTGDWQLIKDNWSLLSGLYGRLAGSFDNELGFCIERNPDGSAKRWHTPEMKLNLQIATMQSVSHMAEQVGDISIKDQADNMLQRMYQARVELGEYVQNLYDQGIFQPIENRDTDNRQVYWTDGARWEIFYFPTSASGSDPGIITYGHGIYSDLIGYRPMFPELGAFLGKYLGDETKQYVQSVVDYNPWWYWNDAAHNIQGSAENLYNRPHLSTAMFQAKAYILGEDFDTLKDQLPWEYTEAGFKDVYRVQNLVVLLRTKPLSDKSVSSVTADHGEVLTYTLSLLGTGATATITDAIPAGTAYVPNSAQVEPQVGTLTADASLIHWTGVLTEYVPLELTFAVNVAVTEPFAIVNTASVDNGEENRELTVTTIANGLKSYLPIIMKKS